MNTVGNDLSLLESVVVFVGIPALVVLVLVLAILAPGWTRAGRYRPGEPWNYEPVLIGPAPSGDIQNALTSTQVGELGDSGQIREEGQGGASAGW